MEEKILNRPVPKPRQRIHINIGGGPSSDDVADVNANLKKYENISIDGSMNKNNNYDIYNLMTNYTDHNKLNDKDVVKNLDLPDTAANHQNFYQNNDNAHRPIPAPRKTSKPSLYPNLDIMTSAMKEEPTKKSTGAIRKAPLVPNATPSNNIDSKSNTKANQIEPKKVHTSNKEHSALMQELNNNFDKSKSPSNNTINSSNSSGSNGDCSSPKYKTSSPGTILKSLGTSSKELTVSIGERLGAKTKSIFSGTGTTATSTLKNVRSSMKQNLTFGRNTKKREEPSLDRPQTLPANDEIFKAISFYSPLNSKANNFNDLSKTKSHELPTYEDALSSKSNSCISTSDTSSSLSLNSTAFSRNSHLTQSLYSNPAPQRKVRPLPRMAIFRNKSESNLLDENMYNNLSNSKSTPSSSMESLPCPNFPAPILRRPEEGKLKTVPESGMIDEVQIRKRFDYENVEIRNKPINSDRATIDTNETHSTRLFSRQTSMMETRSDYERHINPSSSWSYYDVSNIQQNDDSDSSTPEPIYANDAEQQPVYGKICEMETNLLKPERIIAPRSNRISIRNNQDASIDSIVEEFDPLIQAKVDEICRNSRNELSLIENLLGESTYGQIAENVASEDEDGDVLPPPRLDHLVKPPRKAPKPPQNVKPKSVIIHQNLSLRSDSMENILDESVIDRHLVHGSDDENINLVEPVDLRRPTPPTTHWFVDDKNKPVEGQSSPKNARPKMPGHRQHRGPLISPKTDGNLPTYNDVLSEIHAEKELNRSMNNLNVAEPSSPSASTSVSTPVAGKKFFTNVLNLRRKNSLKEVKNEVRTMLEMVPKPTITEKNVVYKGHLLKLPSGVIEDIMKELSPRNVEMKDKKFSTYVDANQTTTAKEQFLFKYVTSIQCVIKHRFNNEGGLDIHCFEINTALPKNVDKQPTLQQTMSNPNMVMTSNNSGNTKTIRISYVFGIHKKQERNVWMQKLIQNMTDVFPANYTQEFTRAGWCYLKKSISSEWSGAWLMLARRKLIFYSNSEKQIEVLDLRKARCLGYKESDETINNLHVEKGPTMLLDCPPYTIYFIMSSMRETKIWRNCIRESAHNNGTTLKHQQLTKDNVPVLVDKCINFVYAHGSMSEGVYRKPGSTNNVQKLLAQFKTDAFSVQILRSEYNEHDVSSALKKFMRELPEPLIGKLANSFIGVSQMKTKSEKLEAYKELLMRLPEIEYQTLKKLMGHLNFIQSQKFNNRMNVENLAMIWGPTILQDQSIEGMQYSQSEANVVTDLVTGYKILFQMSADEIQTEKIMLEVLQKYHAAAENLSDTVKQSGDLKVWVILDTEPENTTEEKIQANVTLTPTKTALEVCSELATKMKMAVGDLTLSEYISNGELHRPLHYNEKVLDTVLRWTYWPEADRKNNYLTLRPKSFMTHIEHAILKLPAVSPNSEIKFADRKTRSLKSYTLELFENKITVLKKEKNGDVKLKEIDVRNVIAYLGCEKKRDLQMRWAITLVEIDFKKRTRDSPFIGHVLAGTNANDQIIWFTSILYSLYKNDVVPNVRRSRNFV